MGDWASEENVLLVLDNITMAQHFYALKVLFELRILILNRKPNRILWFWNFKIRVRTEPEKNRTEPYGLDRFYGPDWIDEHP